MNTLQAIAFALVIAIALGLIVFVIQQGIPDGSGGNTNPASQTDWVEFQPKQCQQIPWRADWAATNKKPYDSFPAEKDLDVMKSYYVGKGIRILDAKAVYDTARVTCEGCGCAEAFAFQVYVSRNDAGILQASGFTLVNPGTARSFFGLN